MQKTPGLAEKTCMGVKCATAGAAYVVRYERRCRHVTHFLIPFPCVCDVRPSVAAGLNKAHHFQFLRELFVFEVLRLKVEATLRLGES